MAYLPDSNAWIQIIRYPSSLVRVRMSAHPPDEINFCSPVPAELYRGAIRSRFPAEQRAVVDALASPHQSLPFDDLAADRYATTRVSLERQGQMIGHFDLQIAAIALVHGLTVVTHNTGEFSRVPGLSVEDWELP